MMTVNYHAISQLDTNSYVTFLQRNSRGKKKKTSTRNVPLKERMKEVASQALLFYHDREAFPTVKAGSIQPRQKAATLLFHLKLKAALPTT